MKRILLGTLIVVLAGMVGTYIIVRPLVAPAAQTIAAEAALATDDLVLLAAVNVRQLVFLERWFLGTPVIRAAEAQPPHPPAERSLLEHLAAARVDARRDIEHVLYGLYPASERGVRHAVVIVGQFDAAAIERYLAGELGGVARPVGGRTAYELRRVNPDRCDDVTTWMITVDPRWMLISDPAGHDALVPRLSHLESADQAKLAWWRPLAHADVFSVGMWRPRDADKSVSGPLLKTSARAMLAQATGVEHVYLGLGAKTVPPSGRLRLIVDAADGAPIRQKVNEWQRALQQSRGSLARTAPSVAALLDSVSVKADANRQTVEFTVDRTLASNLERVVNEMISFVFAGLGGRREPASRPAQQAERVDTDATAFVPVVQPSTLGAYDSAATFAEDVDRVEGPFGVRLGAMRLPSAQDSGLELDVEAFAGAIPNITAGGERAQISVDSVTSVTGQELLRVEPCGRQRNAVPTTFTASGSQRLRATKAVRLLPGADPRTLGTISGHVDVRLPARVETVQAARPAAGATLTAHGASVTLTKIDGGELQYQITGARDRVLDVRALNAAGRPLATDMKLSSDFFLGDGRAVHAQYAGVIDRVEAVFAVDEQALRWPFKLTDLSMAGKPSAGRFRDTTPDFRPYGVQALRRDVRQPNPFELSLDRAQTFFTTRLEFTLRAPTLPNLEHAFTVGRLAVSRIELKDGTVLTPTSTPWETAIRFGAPAKNGVLTRPLYVQADGKLAPDSIKAVAGTLTMQFPRKLRMLHLDELVPGAHGEVGDLTITVAARGRRSLTLRASAEGDRVVYVKLTDADDQPIMSFTPNVTEAPDGAWRFELSPQGPAAHADVLIAADVERKQYPFRLELK
jgi:hypothetical protein